MSLHHLTSSSFLVRKVETALPTSFTVRVTLEGVWSLGQLSQRRVRPHYGYKNK